MCVQEGRCGDPEGPTTDKRREEEGGIGQRSYAVPRRPHREHVRIQDTGPTVIGVFYMAEGTVDSVEL